MIYEKLFVGIDVSKLKHDIAIMNENKLLVRKCFVIKENRFGYECLLRTLDKLQQKYETQKFHIGLEATSDYWKNIYYFLKKQSEAFVLTVINPIRTKAFAKTALRRASNDPVAAKDIALFMVEKQPAPSIDREPILDCIDSLLATIPGISRETAIILEAYIGDVMRFRNVKKIVAYFGMNPPISMAGRLLRASYLRKKGNPIVRQKLFMATIGMIGKKIAPIYTFYKRLIDAGKPKPVAIGAAMRKLLVIIYYMLKKNENFKFKGDN